MDNRTIVTEAFKSWADGSGYVSAIFADEMTWEIAGLSAASRKYPDKAAFVTEVLEPFGTRFDPAHPFRPTKIRGIYADDSQDCVTVIWDGAGTTIDGGDYTNSYAWIMRLSGGKVVDGLAFYDSIAFNRLWDTVTPPS